MRIEKDFIGEKECPDNALYGIHGLRALENFPNRDPIPFEWYKAVGMCKLAYYKAHTEFVKLIESKNYDKKRIHDIKPEYLKAMIQAATEVARGEHFEHFVSPATQGGAGTSINMNVNEIIANRSMQILGLPLGSYDKIHPIEETNIYQSTNDVIPSALKIAIINHTVSLEAASREVVLELETLEKKYRNTIRMGYTQMQKAVPTTFGRLFSTYQESMVRDWWRIGKIRERLKTLNLGGSAIGTSLSVPQFILTEIYEQLRNITEAKVARADNLADATSSLDCYVEAHGMIKSMAVNLEKMVLDLRILAADIGEGSLRIPARQVGSSIMPGKVNPVIPEYVISEVHKVYANDLLISNLCSRGILELNPYLPIVGTKFIESMESLKNCYTTLRTNLLKGIIIDTSASERGIYTSPTISTALIPAIGYQKAYLLSKMMKEEKIDITEANKRLGLLPNDKLQSILSNMDQVIGALKMSDIFEDR